MRKTGILNADICKTMAALGHTEYLAVADPGLPIPEGTKVIDISLRQGIPGFLDVLEAIAKEMVIDSYIYAEEMETQSPELLQKMKVLLAEVPEQKISHEQLKSRLSSVKAVIRTGECTPYANVLIEGGVNF